MEILEAFDLTGSYRAAAELAGCDHHTVARYVAAREAGTLTADPATRAMAVDPYRAKLWGVGGAQPRQAARRCRPRQAGRAGLPGVGAHHPAGGGRGQVGLAGRQPAGLPALGPRAGDVVAVGLRRRADGRRAGDPAVLRLAGVEPVPGGAADLRQGPAERGRLPGHRAAPVGWGADLWADRQREDGHRRARGPDPGPQPRDGGCCSPLRAADRDLPARRPRGQGRGGGGGAGRQGRPGPDRGEPAGRLPALRRPGARLPGLLRRGQRPAPPGHPAGAGGGVGRGAHPAASAACGAVHARLRPDPHGRVHDPDGRL